jgi:hypothetical protein
LKNVSSGILAPKKRTYFIYSFFGIDRQKWFDRLKVALGNLVKLFWTKLFNLNIFPARTFGSNIDRIPMKHLGRWSTRLYILVLIITLVILALHTIIQPAHTLTIIFVKPSLNISNNLMNDYSDILQCPCAFISTPYHQYVRIEPIFHQVKKANKLN